MPKQLPQLDERLTAVVELTPPCRLAADVGADHGHTACHLLATGRCGEMIVADVSEKALSRAREKLALHGLESRARFCCADGLNALDVPVDAVILAGMGVQTLVGILSRGKDRLRGATVIVQPNREPEQARVWFAENGYSITGERIVCAAGRYYVIVRAQPGMAAYDAKAVYLGPCLMRERPVDWPAYLRWRVKVLKAERPGIQRMGEIARRDHAARIQWMEEALHETDSAGSVSGH